MTHLTVKQANNWDSNNLPNTGSYYDIRLRLWFRKILSHTIYLSILIFRKKIQFLFKLVSNLLPDGADDEFELLFFSKSKEFDSVPLHKQALTETSNGLHISEVSSVIF